MQRSNPERILAADPACHYRGRRAIVRWILCPPFRSYGRATVSHCGPLRRDRRSAAFPAARGGKWSAVQVARLLEAASIPFDASAVVA
jgi:hypothetical protein